MSEEKKAGGSQPPQVASVVTSPETAQVKISEPGEKGAVDLGQELRGDLEAVAVPPSVDPHVKDALEKLREGTKELAPQDHYDLGMAYMGMGLVDDAVREFNAAKRSPKKAAAKKKKKGAAKKKATPKKASKAKAKAKPKVKPKAKKAARSAKPKATRRR